uniref:2-oxoglutarate dehydrogenase E1 component DHKTD1 n=1 Tax=Hirondellea gigas TaxID=1518452 RepID=A0A2P2I2R9_9CRUS
MRVSSLSVCSNFLAYNILKRNCMLHRFSVAGMHSLTYGNIPVKHPKFKVAESVVADRAENSNAYRLVEAYRKYGYLRADVNPLLPTPAILSQSELDPSQYGISSSSSDCSSGVLAGASEEQSSGAMTIHKLIEDLQRCYCGNLAVEFMHLPSEREREWFAAAMEGGSLFQPPSQQEKLKICELLLESQVWDQFLATKFPSVKRYGGEGAEALVPYYYYTFQELAQAGVSNVLMGMAHRGRLNLLAGVLQLSPQLLFRKMRGKSEFNEQFIFDGDALSHLTSNVKLKYSDGRHITVEVLANPSHLEAVNPVVQGRTRAVQRSLSVGHYAVSPRCDDTSCDTPLTGQAAGASRAPVCMQVHGDAAVRGQGIVQETLALTSVPHFDVGGSLHVIVNNQIGFTTEAEGLSSDVALMARIPIIRANGDNPESVAAAARLAVRYQQQFRRDVFVDVLCWRRHGHNELDNPRITNPVMYAVVDAKRSVPDSYAATLVSDGVITEEQVAAISSTCYERLATAYKGIGTYMPEASMTMSQWRGLQQPPPATVQVWDTGVDADTLKFVAAKSVQTPDSFDLHPHLKKTHVGARLAKLQTSGAIDWATAEAMAFGSLLLQGFGVRLCGQDVGRGTFAHRHCAMVDQTTEERYLPLNDLVEGQKAFLEVANSILSEEAVMGFEYGMSINCKDTLHLWEAQFGDFFNGAQIMIDTFFSSGENKWLYQSGMVLLLPHGYDGAGPEHSSCRIERFLSLCESSDDRADGSDVNMSVATPTTPAQYFHLLRQQMVRPYRKPLVVVAPKVMLRMSAATSDVTDMEPGKHFCTVIDDSTVTSPSEVRRVVLVSGKHYYTLHAERNKRSLKDTAIVRVESLCPFPAHELNMIIKKYSNANKIVWAQEEPRNQGTWPFMFPRFLNICGSKVYYAGRPAMAAPAVGIPERHHAEVLQLMDQTFA